MAATGAVIAKLKLANTTITSMWYARLTNFDQISPRMNFTLINQVRQMYRLVHELYHY